ncbi:MAG TPA: ATP-binding protein [Streptosporangiaceae bacterium]|nr:ATP-binding protein [Streptosporangiaceae bacterium]
MEFLNRTDELGVLGRRLAGDRAELLVVYGRRRVGKTELLTHLASKVRSLYFEAADTVKPDQLRDLTKELARISGNELLAAQPLASWEAALAAVAEFVGTQRTLVVFDEFQLLAKQAPELETVLSRWWRTTGRTLPLVLVLAGSDLSFFEDQVLAGRLYGRRTGQLKVLPFLASEAALFHPGYGYEDRVRAYSICGGVPYYLERFTDDRPLAEHLLHEVFERTGLLHDEAELMLRQSITDPANHIAVLRSIAHGHNRNSTISQRTRLEAAHVTKILNSLERLGLVSRLRPITASPRAKKIAYRISDQFLRFHYRFVEPARSQLRTSALAGEYLERAVLPQLDHHASQTWEDICQEYVLRTVPDVSAVGRWWGQVPTGEGARTEEREIDVVGVDARGRPLVLGMCKWTSAAVDFDELNLLDRLAPYVDGHAPDVRRFVFSRSGFSARLRSFAADDRNLTLVPLADIYR